MTSDVRDMLASVAVIPVTPFDREGRIDVARYGALIDDLYATGFQVVTPNGNTGEFHALSADEHRVTVRAATQVAGGRGLVIAGIGFDIDTAVAMGRFAGAAGARAVMIHQPVHPARSDRGWVLYHQAIARALPELALIPYIRDPLVTPTMLRSVVEACPNLVGVKYAVADVLAFGSMVDQLADLDLAWICGLAEPWAPFMWLAGARGFTSGLANVHPRLSLRILDRLQAGDYEGVMRAWRVARPFEELRQRRGNANNVPVVKEALHQQGRCERTVRPPLVELASSEQQEVSAILADWSGSMTGEAAW